MDMPDRILARYLTTGTHGMVCERVGMYHGKGGLNAKKTTYVRQDLAQSLADALEGMVREFEKIATVVKPLHNAEELEQAKAALANYRKGE